MTPSPFNQLPGLPYYPEPTLYHTMAGVARAWEFNGWKPESLSWKTGCYIHAGLSPAGRFAFRGPDAERMLSSICVNSFAKFPIGTMKHAILCTEEGLIAAHGILQRHDAEEFHFFAGGPWPNYMLGKSAGRVETRHVDDYLLQIAGPTSLETLERATGEDLRDLRFLHFRPTSIGGKRAEIARIGMSGNIAFELRGPMQEAAEVYDRVYRAGRDFGIQRLGWRTYLVNHVEGGFPQMTWTFASAGETDPGYCAFMESLGMNVGSFTQVSGSVDPRDMRARYRTPVEVGWERAVRFDHEFVGRAALEREMADPRRKIVMLRWNPQDVIDIYASLLRPGEEYKTLELPTTPPWLGFIAHADQVTKAGRDIGVSSGTIYSYYFREVLSMATIDVAEARIGNEVVVRWGDFGRAIKDVRATVARFPYLAEGRNDGVDLRTLPASISVPSS